MSETKSAGVPAGATHVCRLHNSYWRKRRTVPGAVWMTYILVGNTACPEECVFQLEPIAEAGPAPTTATPAEKLSGKRFEPKDLIYEPDRTGIHPAEQPGKAADPRPAHLTDSEIEKQYPTPPGELTRDEWRQVIPLGIDIVHKLSTLHLRTRPAEPQAPAEPTQEQIEKATAVVANLWGPKSLHVALVGKIAAALAAEAAPLREERDRLAEQLAKETRFREAASRQYADANVRLLATDAKVAERDARIEKLEGALALALTYVRNPVEHYHTVPGVWNDDERNPERAGQKCAECAPFVAVEARLHATLVGAPEENT